MATTVDASGLRQAVTRRGEFIARRVRLDLDRDLRENARQHRDTGEMERNLRVRSERISPTVWRITGEDPVVQAATTDRGARPHTIRPRRARALRFVMDGRVVYASVVHHPGNAPSRWFSSVWTTAHVRGILARFVGR